MLAGRLIRPSLFIRLGMAAPPLVHVDNLAVVPGFGLEGVGLHIDAAQVGAENVTFRSVRNNAITLEILMARLGLVEGVSEAGLIASLDDDLRRQ